MKKILLIFFILFIILAAAIIYLNQVVLPIKVKSLIIQTLQETTQKKVSLQSVKFNIFKGLVLKNLVIYDEQNTIISIKEGSCVFLILPIFKKKIIIPTLSLKSPYIFLERKKDSTFNIQDLFLSRTTSTPKAGISPSQGLRRGFNIFIYRLSITDARIHFQDNTLSPAFGKDIVDLDLILYLSLPASVKFTFKSEIQGLPSINLNASGEYKIIDKQLSGQFSIKDLSFKEFQAYCRDIGIAIPKGIVDASINLNLKDNVINAKISAQSKDLAISKDEITLNLNSQIDADLKYNLKDKQWNYSGIAVLTKSDIMGLGVFDQITNINGQAQFDNSGIFSDRLSANIWAVPVEAKLNLSDFKRPLLHIDITSSLELGVLQGILKDKFKLSFPVDIQGKTNLLLKVETKLPLVSLPQINGSLDILNAIVGLKELNSSFEEINGRVEFDLSQIRWSGINFKYSGLPYAITGVLKNFKSPNVQLELSSNDLSLESAFLINQKLIKLSKLKGQYLNSKFLIKGDIDTAEAPHLAADLAGKLSIDLQDIKVAFKKFKDQLEQIRPEGIIDAQFSLKGNIKDLKSCVIKANLSSPLVCAYGLNAREFSLNYSQADGLIDISPIQMSFYDGAIEASAKMNLNSGNLPYWISTDIRGVKIEKLKMDTAAKDKDIAGTIAASAKLNGFYGDLSKLSGAGQINIKEGNLWQLNLFQGLGHLLFTKDFTNIIFYEGSCGLIIKDKYIYTDNLRLKSNIVDLDGYVKIGFDTSIDASLNIQVLDEMVPLSGTFKDITTAILGQAGRFGTIKINGTLKEPKYKFQPVVTDIIKGLKDIFSR